MSTTSHHPGSPQTDVDGSGARTAVLHVLRLGGFVAVGSISARTGLAESEVRSVLDLAATEGLVVERSGRIAGWSLTPTGRTEHARLLAAELDATGARASVEAASAAFLDLNQPFKELCARWQLRPGGDVNDHSDRDYDSTVIADLAPVHTRVVALTSELSGALSRFARYPRAFQSALDRLTDGDTKAFAAPLSDSYHDAWMELHQDLLSTLGRERSAADGH